MNRHDEPILTTAEEVAGLTFDDVRGLYGQDDAMALLGIDDGSVEPDLAGVVVDEVSLMDLFGDLDPVLLASLRTPADEEALIAAVEMQLERETSSVVEQAAAEVIELHPHRNSRSQRRAA